MTTKKPTKPPKVIVPEAPKEKHIAKEIAALEASDVPRTHYVATPGVTLTAIVASLCLACGNPKDGVCAACGN